MIAAIDFPIRVTRKPLYEIFVTVIFRADGDHDGPITDCCVVRSK
ncbi:hypothetical protein [Tardiphaga sp.]